MIEYVSGQKKMELIYKETFENKENLVDLFYGREYPKNEDEKNVNVSIYGESMIRDSHKKLLQKLVNFNDDLYNFLVIGQAAIFLVKFFIKFFY